MMPTAEDICSKEIITIGIDSTINEAVTLMTKHSVRSVILHPEDNSDYFKFTTNDAIEFKIQQVSMETKLSDITLRRIKKIDANTSIVELMDQKIHIDEYYVVMKELDVIGILSQKDVVNNLDPKVLMQKQTIGNIMLQYSAITVFENEASVNAVKLMKYKSVDAIIILGENDIPKGIFTTKDFLKLLKNDEDLNKPIKHFMSSPIQTVADDILIFDAIEFIKERKFKRVVVTDNEGKIAGMISQSELLRVVNNKWMELVKKRGQELSQINEQLLEKAAKLEEKASTDYLTQLFNRRKFNSVIEYEISQNNRYENRYLSVIILDIDNFKSINDTHGHDIGDKVLQEIASIINISCREADVASRWGGEEFAIGLPQTTIEDAVLVAEKIRMTIERHNFSTQFQVTASLGVAQLRTTDSFSTLFKRADEALYNAKHTGKNKTVIEHI